MSTADDLTGHLGATHVRRAEFQSADRSTKFYFVSTDALPSRWILRQDGVLIASGVAETSEGALEEGVIAAKDVLGHDFICNLD